MACCGSSSNKIPLSPQQINIPMVGSGQPTRKQPENIQSLIPFSGQVNVVNNPFGIGQTQNNNVYKRT